MSGDGSVLERLLLRDRLVVGLGLAAVTLLSWGYLLTGAGMEMPSMLSPTGAMPASGWSLGQAALIFVMWWVMMLAMMLPSAGPMILLFASVAKGSGRPMGIVLFVSGYLLVWGGFSVIATLMHWTFTQLGLLADMRVNSLLLAGLLLLVAGGYQLTPAKAACLKHCRSPLRFVTEHWRSGSSGALEMGLRHGFYCLGCCWALMTLLFAGGVMNIAWIGLFAAYVLIEKIAPVRCHLSLASAYLLIAAGAVLFWISLD